MSNIKQKFALFLLADLLLWSLMPLLRHSLSIDTQEAIVWGKYCLLGTTKHPPLSGWIAYAFWNLFGRWDGAMYLLSQIFVVLGVVYIYRLARCFLDETRAILAAILQFGIIYYDYSTPEFNVNVISVALWPMCAYYFWCGYIRNWWRDWLLFGVLVGLNLLNKYVGGILLVALGLFVIADKGVLRLSKNIKVYIAGAVAVLLLAPHIWWLWQNDFVAFNYIVGRSHGGSIVSVWRYLFYPLKFLAAQLLFAAPALMTYAWFSRKYGIVEKERSRQRSESLFILCATLIPVMVFVLLSLISGNAAKSMWGFPCLFMWGIALFYFVPIKIDAQTAKRFFKVMSVWVVLFAIAYGAQCLLTTSQRYQTDVRAVATQFEQKWAERTAKPLQYVGADVWFGDIMALYGSHEIKPMIWMSPKNNPWFDKDDFERSGALLIATSNGEYAQYQEMYGAAVSSPQILSLEFKNYFGKTERKEILFGFFAPWEDTDAESK